MIIQELLSQGGTMQERVLRLPGSPEVCLPISLLTGKHPGKTVVISAGVHGCEYVGIEALQRFKGMLDPEKLSGNVILLPLVNPRGFYEGAKQEMPEDGKNLNRVFPGKKEGSYSERMAYLIEKELYPFVDFWLDLHGGDVNEDLQDLVFFPVEAGSAVAETARNIAMKLSVPYRVQSHAKNGLYSWAAQKGIPALLLERGGKGVWSEDEIELELGDLYALLEGLNIYRRPDRKNELEEQWEIADACYVEASADGCWYPKVHIHTMVEKGMVLGELRDTQGRLLETIRADFSGVVLYYTLSLGVQAGSPLIAYGAL